ncbi:hypothetical protein WMF30_10230 [Sorangium sp. So ce134]
MNEPRRTFEDVLAEREAKLRAVPRPVAGWKVERLAQLKATVDGRLGMKIAPISGVVLAVVDDRRAAGGWVAMIRWWNPSTQRWRWDTHDAEDFREDAGTFRVKMKAKRSVWRRTMRKKRPTRAEAMRAREAARIAAPPLDPSRSWRLTVNGGAYGEFDEPGARADLARALATEVAIPSEYYGDPFGRITKATVGLQRWDGNGWVAVPDTFRDIVVSVSLSGKAPR